jgi:hypothetical protein
MWSIILRYGEHSIQKEFVDTSQHRVLLIFGDLLLSWKNQSYLAVHLEMVLGLASRLLRANNNSVSYLFTTTLHLHIWSIQETQHSLLSVDSLVFSQPSCCNLTGNRWELVTMLVQLLNRGGVFLVPAVLIFCDQTLDNLDGKQQVQRLHWEECSIVGWCPHNACIHWICLLFFSLPVEDVCLNHGNQLPIEAILHIHLRDPVDHSVYLPHWEGYFVAIVWHSSYFTGVLLQ